MMCIFMLIGSFMQEGAVHNLSGCTKIETK